MVVRVVLVRYAPVMVNRRVPATDLARVRWLTATGQARRIRERAHVSRGELARALGLTGPTVSRWEGGQRFPRGATAVAYLRLLDRLQDLGPRAVTVAAISTAVAQRGTAR
jgi:DNA-binding transcriptional regulator YiaG